MTNHDMKILIGLHRAKATIDARSNQIFTKYNLTIGQFGVLEALYHKGNLSVGQVQEKILSSSGTIPLIIRNLEKRALIIRLPDKTDGRKCLLELTDLGVKLIEEVYPQNERCIIESLSVLQANEKQVLLNLLKKIGGFADESKSEK